MDDASQVIVRKAGEADATLLADLGARAFFQSFAGDNSPEDMDAYLKASFSPVKQAAELSAQGSTFFIAEEAGTPVGYARLLAGNLRL